jgi:hypothetical protein
MGDDPLEQLKALKAPPGDPLEELKKLRAPVQPSKLAIARRNAAKPHPEDLEEDDPSYAQRALGGVAAIARDIPGAEALQATARTVVRGEGGRADLTTPEGRAAFAQSYRESLDEIRKAEESAPAISRVGNRVIGATVAAAVTPGSNVLLQGARYGILSGLLKAEPATVENRLHSAAKEGAVGAAAGAVGEGVGVAGRSLFAKSLGKVGQARRAAMEAADQVNYGKAAHEGELAAANPTPAAVSAALNEPDIKPYAAIVRASRTLKGADDATVLRETYKLMTERQGQLGKRILSTDDYKAGTELEQADIGAGKRILLNAADQVMPSFREAVYSHARQQNNREAFIAAADATNRILKGTTSGGRKLEQSSPEAFQSAIDGMSQEQASAAIQGLLGRLKSQTGLLGVSSANPFKGFGIPKNASAFAKMIPYLEALDAKAAPPNPMRLFERRPGMWRPQNPSRLQRAVGIGATALSGD